MTETTKAEGETEGAEAGGGEQDKNGSAAATSPGTGGAEAAAPAASAGGNPSHFLLKTGAEVAYGPRAGAVESVRGGSGQADGAYEVMIRWRGEKYPEWYLYATLKRLHDQGEFKILRQGKGTVWERLRSLLPS